MKMPSIKSIGNVEKNGSNYLVKIEKKYANGLKHLEKFSHIHIIFADENKQLSLISGRINEFDKAECQIKFECNLSDRIRNEKCSLSLIDIKPYMPSEDNAVTECRSGINKYIKVCDNKENEFNLEFAGEIRNTSNIHYLQFNDDFKMPENVNEYVHVLWWFNKFDEPKYRRILECETPYESEGKTGVFACRAPVRLNPIAITTVKVLKVDSDNNRIYVSSIESFDHTPFLGVIDYDVSTDKYEKKEVTLPYWADNWAGEIQVSCLEKSGTVEEQIRLLDADFNFAKYNEKKSEKVFKLVQCEKERPTHIVVKGARENNLKGINVSIPYGKITAVVGVSGSGKSSLVMDTVYAECQRRMEGLENDNAARQRPEMESMTGCVPVVMISQNEIRANSNSTIGTFCGINHHLRSIYASIGERHFERADKIKFKLTPSTFSFLDPECRCSACNGKGRKKIPDIDKIITNPSRSLLDGASPFLGNLKSFIESPNANWMKGQVVALAKENNVDLSTPWNELPEDFKHIVLYGDETRSITFSFDNKKTGRKGDVTRKLEGIIPAINRIYIEEDNGGMSTRFMSEFPCNVCKGERLEPEGRLVTVMGVRFPLAAGMSFFQIKKFVSELLTTLPSEKKALVKEHFEAIISCADTATRLGIGQLEMSRDVSMISAGEAQRVKLLGAFQNHMTGILYIFDEPSKKLSLNEYKYIAAMLRELINDGNTVLMVEHNMDMIKIADYVIEIGPESGKNGGYLCAEGKFEDVIKNKNSQLGRYASSYDHYDRNKKLDFEFWSEVKNVTANNMINVSIMFPKNALCAITGVSGSGKSTLLYKGILPQMEKSNDYDSVVLVESKIAGSSSRSVVATYIGIMDHIRNLFAGTKEAIAKKYSDKDFSFNTGFLRCPECKGDGRIKIPFTKDSFNICPLCHGKRYSKEADDILLNGKTISEVLAMSALEACDFFDKINSKISEMCSFLIRVGLSYLSLGQGTATLSGGEATRLKIASCLMNASMTNSLFLLDEPTCGLHFSDIDNLIGLLDDIIKAGNTVVAIEHNKRFLSVADYTITVGPGAGKEGGKIL